MDEVQGYANAVEKHLRDMRAALREKNLEAAEEQYEQARDTLQENRASLTAYPELAELEAAVAEADCNLCYHAVSLALEKTFDQVRARDWTRPGPSSSGPGPSTVAASPRSGIGMDYLPLKMNLDTAPQALTALEKELARPALLARMKQRLQALGQQKAALQAKLAALDAQPNQRDLAVELDAQLKALRQELTQPGDFSAEPEWLTAAAALTGSLDEMDTKRGGLVRRGKLLSVAGEALAAADRASVQAVTAKNKPAARQVLEGALATYRQGLQVVEQVLAEEPGLARYLVPYQGRKRSGAWLKSHLTKSARTVERMLHQAGRQEAAEGPAEAQTEAQAVDEEEAQASHSALVTLARDPAWVGGPGQRLAGLGQLLLGGGDHRAFRAEFGLQDRQRPTQDLLGLVRSAREALDARQAHLHLGHTGVIGAEGLVQDGERAVDLGAGQIELA